MMLLEEVKTSIKKQMILPEEEKTLTLLSILTLHDISPPSASLSFSGSLRRQGSK